MKADVCISMAGVEMSSVTRIKYDCPKIAEFHFSFDSFDLRGKSRRLPKFINTASRMKKFVVLTKEDAQKWKKF